MSKNKQQPPPPSIVGIAPATGWLAGFASPNAEEEDRLLPVVAWTVMRDPKPSEPDEVVGQVWQGEYLTESPAIEDEEGDYTHVGYFTDDAEGKANFKAVCKASRGEIEDGLGDDDEDDDDEDEDEDEDLLSADDDEDDDEDDEDDDEEDEDGDEEDDD